MKKLLLLSMIIVLLAGCKSKSKIASQTEHMDVASQKALKGNWEITDVKFSGPGYYKITSFRIADSKCFVGSQWNFVSNNNKGSLRLNKADCPAFSSPIVWSINKQGMFGLKITAEGTKPSKTDEGFMLRMANQTGNSFELVDDVDVGGSKKELIYHFERR